MARGMVHFERMLTHYILLALKRAGANITSNTHAELSSAFVELERAIEKIVKDEISQRISELSGDW